MAPPSTDTDGVKAEEAPQTAAGGVASGDAPATATAATAKDGGEIKKWPGWPGDNVFRMVVPVVKVGSLIGKKGELIKKLCEETRAKVRILDGVAGTTDRIVRTPNT